MCKILFSIQNQLWIHDIYFGILVGCIAVSVYYGMFIGNWVQIGRSSV